MKCLIPPKTEERALTIAKAKVNYVESKNELEHSIDLIPHSNESAFALFLENDCSKAQWEQLVDDSKNHGAKIYPSFYKMN